MWSSSKADEHTFRSARFFKLHLVCCSGCLMGESNSYGLSITDWCLIIWKLCKVKKLTNKDQLAFPKLDCSVQEFMESVTISRGKVSWIFHRCEHILLKLSSETILATDPFVFQVMLHAFISFIHKKQDLGFLLFSWKENITQMLIGCCRNHNVQI